MKDARTTKLLAFTVICASVAFFAVLGSCTRKSDDATGRTPPLHVGTDQSSAPMVTPVEGQSWLKHLGMSDDMGRIGGGNPPASSQRQEPNLLSGEGVTGGGEMGGMMRRIYPQIRLSREKLSELMDQTFQLSGSDLYRLNCQSCHGPKGEGAPPEIKSLLGPVQGGSVAFVMDRMKRMGRPVSEAFARQLAAGADSTLHQRLREGGEKMPPFRHLRGDEVDALIQYLRILAGVPDSGAKEMDVPQSVARVGEHLVKGTCRICHDATGPGGGRMSMMSGVIPSLASFPEQQSLQDVVRQVELGSSPMMSMMGGPTMPAFPYITEDEAAAAYLYLMEYPPQP